MRRALVLVSLFALAACPSALAAPVFVVTGHGWGHGIGMSQYGSYGYARHGWTYRRILAHYYTGTRVGKVPPATVRVLLDVGRSSVTLRSDTKWRVKDGSSRAAWTLVGGTRTIRAGLKVKIGGATKQLVPPVVFTRLSGGPLDVDGRPYRGSIVLRKPGAGLATVNSVGLQGYLYGVVPWEMRASWSPEALKVQAVAARSYALAGRRTGSYFDLYDDTRSQVYGGVSAEDPRTNAAVNATAGEIRTYRGRVAQTFFFSTSGGRTAANEDVWGGTPVPYLRSVVDPYDGISRYHDWGPYLYSRAAMDSALGARASGRIRDLKTTINPSRRVSTVTARGSGGQTAIGGTTFQAALGLRSNWFRIGVLNLIPARTTVVYGRRVSLRGLARGVGAAWLERKPAGEGWTKVRDLTRSSASTFKTLVKPPSSRSYRVRSARAPGRGRFVSVAPRIAFYHVASRTRVRGLVRPRRTGAPVAIQRYVGGAWKTVATGKTNANGDFSLAVALRAGSYRALATIPGPYARGVSPTLELVDG